MAGTLALTPIRASSSRSRVQGEATPILILPSGPMSRLTAGSTRPCRLTWMPKAAWVALGALGVGPLDRGRSAAVERDPEGQGAIAPFLAAKGVGLPILHRVDAPVGLERR